MSGNTITIFEVIEGDSWNSIAIDNTAIYISNLQVNSSITLGNLSSLLIINSSTIFVGNSTVNATINSTSGGGGGGGGGGISANVSANLVPTIDLGYNLGNTEFRWGNSYIDQITANQITIAGLTLSSTGYNGTAANTLYVGGTSAANVVSNTQLQSNLSYYALLTGANFSGTVNTGNLNVNGNLIVSGNLQIDGTTTFINSTVITTADKNLVLANTATTRTAANGAGLIIGSLGQLLYDNNSISFQTNINLTPLVNNQSLGLATNLWNLYANQITGTLVTSSQPNITANNSSYLGGTAAASYQLNSTLAANVATMTANNSSYLGGILASSYQLNSTLAANVATMTANNSSYLGGILASSYQLNSTLAANVATMAANDATYLNGQLGTYYANVTSPSFSANISVGSNVFINTTELQIGNSTANLVINSTVILLGNSTVNSSINATIHSGTSNNATYFAGQPQGYYANVTSPSFSANISVGSNVLVNTSVLLIGNSTANMTMNSISMILGNTTVNVSINATTFTGISLTANNSSYLNGNLPAYYTNAQNFTNVLNYTQIPVNIVNTTGNFTLAGNTTFSANIILQSALSANGSVGGAAAVLTSGGGSGNVYWGSTSSYQLNSTLAANVATMAANNATYLNGQLSTYYANVTSPSFSANISVGSNVFINTSTLSIGNSTVNVSINSTTSFGGGGGGGANLVIGNSTVNTTISNNALTILGSATVGNAVLNSTTLFLGNSSANIIINSTSLTASQLIINTISVNGSIGSNGKIITSNGTINYWTPHINSFLLMGA